MVLLALVLSLEEHKHFVFCLLKLLYLCPQLSQSLLGGEPKTLCSLTDSSIHSQVPPALGLIPALREDKLLGVREPWGWISKAGVTAYQGRDVGEWCGEQMCG